MPQAFLTVRDFIEHLINTSHDAEPVKLKTPVLEFQSVEDPTINSDTIADPPA
jgi:hypothetical protein